MDDDFIKKFFGGAFGPFGRNNENFDSSFFHNDINRMFQDMEEMMKNFHFGQFNIIESPQFKQPIEEAPREEGNLRDKFLKSPTEKELPKDLVPSQPNQRPRSIFDFFSNSPSHQSNLDRFDEDLDEKIQKEGFDKVLREDLFKQNSKPSLNPEPRIFSSGQSCSIRRIQRPDGSIEEVKTVRNSDGKEEKTITRIIGDKMHSVIEKKNQKEVEETEEIFHNFDENKLDDFNKMWNNFSRSDRKEKRSILDEYNPRQESSQIEKRDDKFSESFLSKLFSWLK